MYCILFSVTGFVIETTPNVYISVSYLSPIATDMVNCSLSCLADLNCVAFTYVYDTVVTTTPCYMTYFKGTITSSTYNMMTYYRGMYLYVLCNLLMSTSV